MKNQNDYAMCRDELSDAPREATFPMITYALPAFGVGLQL
jgi:hypothetical protein